MIRTTPKSTILFLSSYPPRACGIATFTQDLINALKGKINDSISFKVGALESSPETVHNYPEEVLYRLDTSSLNDIIKVGKQINLNDNIKLVCLQHEFGLWGGKMGDNVLYLMRLINKPIITVFHTILPQPDAFRKKLVAEINKESQHLVVMTRNSKCILEQNYGIEHSNISVIPHGTHLVKYKNQQQLKEKYGLEHNLVLSTFGLLGPNKNIETSLKALPLIIKKFPRVKFLILGQTHPELIKKEGEKYRNKLIRLVKKLQLRDHVVFVNKYLTLNDLLEYLILTDLYLFSSKDPNQAVSGTFAYAMSCACPIISTPIPHTREFLKEKIGLLFDFGDYEGLANAAIKLLSDDRTRKDMALNALHQTRASSWENVSIAYMDILQPGNRIFSPQMRIPEINIDHIRNMTTPFGMIQFSKICQPDLESGYTIDDNARALIAMIMYKDAGYEGGDDLIEIYLNFLNYCQAADGRFQNYVDQNKIFHEQNNYVNLEDSNARTIWALGICLAHKHDLPPRLIDMAHEMLRKNIPWMEKVESPRSIAFIIKGLYSYYKYYQEQDDQEIRNLILRLADKLVSKYDCVSDYQWEWFEDYLTYANSIMPEALVMAYDISKNPVYLPVALNTLNFLLAHTFDNNQITVISNKSWFQRGGQKKRFGEQPIDVSYTIQTLETFYQILDSERYLDYMQTAFSWFLGNNHLRQIIYNPVSGGCYDGLEEYSVNLNQGAESTVCYLIARLIIERYVDVEEPEYRKEVISTKTKAKVKSLIGTE